MVVDNTPKDSNMSGLASEFGVIEFIVFVELFLVGLRGLVYNIQRELDICYIQIVDLRRIWCRYIFIFNYFIYNLNADTFLG